MSATAAIAHSLPRPRLDRRGRGHLAGLVAALAAAVVAMLVVQRQKSP